jgi:sugar lactone lactonase YvrE
VIVADTGNQRLVSLSGTGVFQAEFGTSGADFGLSDPSAVAVNPSTGNIYVADTDDNRVLEVAPDGYVIARWGADGGDGASGSGVEQFNRPAGIALNGAGDVYVADTGNNRIEEIGSSGQFVTQWGSAGSADGRFRTPEGIAVDGAGDVFVADRLNHRIQEFSSNGTFITHWGVRGTAQGQFTSPSAVAVSCNGDVWVADTQNNRIQMFTGLARSEPACQALGSWPPPPDVAPALRVRLVHIAGVLARGGVTLSVSCTPTCQLHGTGTVLGPHGARVNLRAISGLIPAGRAVNLRLKLSARSIRRLQRALRRRRGLTARVTLSATGPTGKVTRRIVRYRVRR